MSEKREKILKIKWNDKVPRVAILTLFDVIELCKSYDKDVEITDITEDYEHLVDNYPSEEKRYGIKPISKVELPEPIIVGILEEGIELTMLEEDIVNNTYKINEILDYLKTLQDKKEERVDDN